MRLRLVVEEVLKVEDGGVHPSRIKCEGCDGGVGVGLWRMCVGRGGVGGDIDVVWFGRLDGGLW